MNYNKTKYMIAVSVSTLLLSACGSKPVDTLGGVYETTHKGVEYTGGTSAPADQDYTFKYSFFPTGGCVYVDGQKEREYYSCSYEKTGENTFTATTQYRFKEEKYYVDNIVVKGKNLEITREGSDETYTYSKTNESIPQSTLKDEMEKSDLEKSALSLGINYFKAPLDSAEYYSENSSIPTMDSTIKGVNYAGTESDMYMYTYIDEDDADDIFRAYIMRLQLEDLDVEESNGLVLIKKNGDLIGAIGSVKESEYGPVIIVSPL